MYIHTYVGIRTVAYTKCALIKTERLTNGKQTRPARRALGPLTEHTRRINIQTHFLVGVLFFSTRARPSVTFNIMLLRLKASAPSPDTVALARA